MILRSGVEQCRPTLLGRSKADFWAYWLRKRRPRASPNLKAASKRMKTAKAASNERIAFVATSKATRASVE